MCNLLLLALGLDCSECAVTNACRLCLPPRTPHTHTHTHYLTHTLTISQCESRSGAATVERHRDQVGWGWVSDTVFSVITLWSILYTNVQCTYTVQFCTLLESITIHRTSSFTVRLFSFVFLLPFSRGFIVHSGDHQAVFKPSSVQSMW